jgi:oligosaccharide repeat unit polymerase
MSAMPVFFVEVFGWKARPEHFAAGIVSLAVGVWLLFHKGGVRLEKLDYWILAYLAINFASSAFGSPVPSATLRWALQNSLAVVPYFVIRILVRDSETLRKAFRILLGVGIVESAYGILCYISNHVFGTTTGMSVGQYLYDVAAPYGSMFEPNLFGAYTACSAVLFLAPYLTGGRQLRYLLCFLVTSLAAVLSFSRAALVALVVASGWVFWRARRARNRKRSRAATLALAVGLILVVAVSTIGGVLRERFSGLFNQGLAEETTITRLIVIQEALQEIPNHPLLGSGTASFQLSFDFGKYVPEWAGNPTWVGNVIVRILHDTGLLGLTAILGFLISVWWKIRRELHGRNTQFSMLLGLSAGALLYCISFQSTDGSTLAFTWVHLGFLASAAILINGSSESANGVGATAQRSI